MELVMGVKSIIDLSFDFLNDFLVLVYPFKKFNKEK